MKNSVFIFFCVVFIFSLSRAQVVINEVHYNPANDLTGDANGDGVRSASHDEFIELVNSGNVIEDLSGWTISDADADGICFTFPAKSLVSSSQAVVIFGGGTPTGDFGNALIFKESLGLNNTDNYIVLKNSFGATIDSMTYKTSSAIGKSLTRNPDITGGFVPSTSVGSGKVLFSPGLTVNLKGFSTITFLYEQIENNLLDFFPNPVSNKLFLKGNFDVNTKVELLGLQGEIFSLRLEKDRITIPSYCKNGIWILRVISPQGVFQQKVEILK